MAERTWDWMLFREANGDLVVSVVCGTVGLFEVDVVLSAEQKQAYEAEGIDMVVRLAADIAEHPRKYWSEKPRGSAGA